MAEILELPGGFEALEGGRDRAISALEAGGLVVLPDLAFRLDAAEQALADPASLDGRSKNISLDPTGRLSGSGLEGEALERLRAMTARYAAFADRVLAELLPEYAGAAERKRTSFRPGAIDTRALSPRKDDKRLHVDAFPSSPVGARRILRVFSNVDPAGRDRVWRVGDAGFEELAREFKPRLKGVPAWRRAAMARLGVTRGRRTPYDQAMLELHDGAKLDEAWQAAAPRTEVRLPAGSSWIVFTDSVLHAAMSGQNAFEQTYLMPVEAMRDPELSPQRTLERILGRPLAA